MGLETINQKRQGPARISVRNESRLCQRGQRPEGQTQVRLQVQAHDLGDKHHRTHGRRLVQVGRVDRPRASLRPSSHSQEQQPRSQANMGEKNTRAHTRKVLLFGSGHVRSWPTVEPQFQRL